MQETLYHLCPSGWTPGREPADRVETWIRVVKPNNFVSWRCEWVDIKKPVAERDALRKRYHRVLQALSE
jgi:hypothetical protein